MRPLVAIIFTCLLAFAFIPHAYAGSLGDFKESYEETESENRREEDSADDSDTSSQDDDDGVYDNDGGGVFWALLDAFFGGGSSGCASCSTTGSTTHSGERTEFYWIFGHLPGERFSLGSAPYEGRGRRLSASISGMSDTAVAGADDSAYLSARRYDGSVNDRHFQLMFRGSGLTTLQLDAAGAEVFTKFASTFMPGFVASYQYAGEFASDETLSVGYLAYEPNLYLGSNSTVAANLGAVNVGDGAGFDKTGLTVGLSLEVFPLDPLFAEVRGNFHGFRYVQMTDLRVAMGAFLTDHFAVEANVRNLNIIDGTSLTTAGLGLRVYTGF